MLGQVTIEPVATGTSLVSKDKFLGFPPKLADQLVDVTLMGPDGTERDDLCLAVVGDIGDRDGLFVNIQTDEECVRMVQS